MKSTFQQTLLMVFVISFLLVACNSGDKEGENITTTDTTVSTEASMEETIDAIVASPNLYKVLNDSLGIRILEATYNPGDSSALHTHPDNAIYIAQGGKVDFIGKDGSKTPVEFKSGVSMIRGHDIHSVINTGTTTLKVILVECNRPTTPVTPDPAADPTIAAADNYKTLHDSLGLRILEVNYKPGQSSAFHSHQDLAAYVIEGATAELTDQEGKKNVGEMKSGATWINGPSSHSGKNLGKKPFKMILFEINRPRN